MAFYRVPPNVKFLVDDIESDWAYEGNPFDFIHARYLAAAIKDFRRLIRQCYQYVSRSPHLSRSSFPNVNRSLKPGGWVEFQDWDGFPYSADGSLKDTGLERYFNEVTGTFQEVGYECRPGPKLEQWLKEAGFVNVHAEKFIIPHGVWPKDRHLVSFPLSQNSYKVLTQYLLIRAEETWRLVPGSD